MRARGFRQAGVSLIELVAVITLLAVASVGISSGFAQLGRSQLLDEDTQAATQMAQACAEHILASRRNNSYATAFVDCSLLGAFNGYGPPTVGTFVPPADTCPAGATCRGVDVNAAYGTNGATARVRFMLVSY